MTLHTRFQACALALITIAVAQTSMAEKADRDKPAEITADKASTNEATQTSVVQGNVVISKGTLLIKADRAEIKRDIEGYQMIVATGVAGKPVTFKQKRDGRDETVEAEGARLDFDGKADTVVLTEQAILRRLLKGVQQDEVRGAVVKYFNQTEFYDVKGGPGSSQADGRVRMVLAPRVAATNAAVSSSVDKK